MAGFSFRLIAIPRSAWGSPLPSWPADTFMAPRGSPSPSWPDTMCRRAPEGHRRHHGRLSPSWRPGVSVALMAGYLFRRHHGQLPIPREHNVEPEFGFVPVLSDGTASRLVSLRLTTSFQKTARLVRHGDGAVVCHFAPRCSNSQKRDLDGLSATLLSVGTLSTYTAKSCSIAVFQKHPSRSPKSSMEL